MDKYLLVLQYAMSEGLHYEDVLALEKKILLSRPQYLKLDGHDIGDKEMNVFFYTNNPQSAFMELQRIGQDVLKEAKIAYRDANGEVYTMLYPHGETKFIIT